MTPDDLLRDEADVTERGVDPLVEDPSSPLAEQLEEASERKLMGPGLEPEQEVLTINMGPHHPATHGVLRVIVTLQGERVIDLKPVMGYLHTGIEKSCEDKSYWKVIPFVERMDYLSYFFQMEAFCGCVERLVGLEIP
ncbi:MAG TPA: NADH-quinone oxidoreductase subunit D, partial [Solirubrobacterales bacterium]